MWNGFEKSGCASTGVVVSRSFIRAKARLQAADQTNGCAFLVNSVSGAMIDA